MKKLLAFVVVLFILLTGTSALAANMDVVVIGGGETETTPVSLDDIRIDQVAEIPGYAELTPISFSFQDVIQTYYYMSIDNSHNIGRKHESGITAEYAVLDISILNIQTKSINFNREISNIIITYDDKYQYGGWSYQLSEKDDYRMMDLSGSDYTIGPMYVGRYLVGGTLPNSVISGEKPLRLTFNLGENEITYHIRK